MLKQILLFVVTTVISATITVLVKRLIDHLFDDQDDDTKVQCFRTHTLTAQRHKKPNLFPVGWAFCASVLANPIVSAYLV